MLIKIALASLRHRKATVLLTLCSIAVSVAIVLCVANIYQQTKQSFTRTISGTDLVVGAPSGRINLLLYSVFRVGNATNNITWQSYQTIAQQKEVAWTVPISLGDSHKGFRVMGTTGDYFQFYRYGSKQNLAFQQGKPFEAVYDVVLGAEVARQLKYELGEKIVLSHGIAAVSFSQHDDKPFTVTGILKPTGTPVDQTLHINLAGMEAIHIDWRQGAPIPGMSISAEEALTKDLTPKTITAFMVGLKNKVMTFRLQRKINQYKGEPLLAILPGVALSELWQTMGMVETILQIISAMVVVAALIGMVTMMLSTLSQRQREMAILRACGASAGFIFALIIMEVLLISILALVVGSVFLWGAVAAAKPFILGHYGLTLSVNPFSEYTLIYSGAVIVVAVLLAFIPASMAYKQSISQGLQQ